MMKTSLFEVNTPQTMAKTTNQRHLEIGEVNKTIKVQNQE
jgi:hypothetical protein